MLFSIKNIFLIVLLTKFSVMLKTTFFKILFETFSQLYSNVWTPTVKWRFIDFLSENKSESILCALTYIQLKMSKM